MKPKDLRIPIEENKGRSFIHDRLFRIPKLDEKSFIFPGWNHPDVFGNDNEVHLEYCSGNGGWVGSKALSDPQINWVGIEMKLGRSRKIWAKIKNFELPNLFVINGEGYHATVNYLPSASVHKIYINFPDPWPKRRHSKNRIIQPKFLAEMARILIPGGSVLFVTDDPEYSDWTIDIFANSKSFVSHYPAPFYSCDLENYGTSFFDALWREKGKTIRYHHYVKF